MEVVLGPGHVPLVPGLNTGLPPNLQPAGGLQPTPGMIPTSPQCAADPLAGNISPPVEQTNGQQEHATALLTVRVLMQGKEVGSIIGKRGENIKRYREESKAKINISDGSCPERIVTVTGTPDTINTAFCMICGKFEEDLESLPDGVPKPPVTLRLLVPATQCGSIIGRGGMKIREIREATGASIQVAGEALPQSSERAVTVSGTADSICRCIVELCKILLDSPPKVPPLLYRPKPAVPPIILPGGQTLILPSQLGPMPLTEMQKLSPTAGGQLIHPMPLQLQAPAQQILPGLPGGMVPMLPAGLPTLPASSPGLPNTAPSLGTQQQSMEMSIPNELIGCVIGRQGQKIQEISMDGTLQQADVTTPPPTSGYGMMPGQQLLLPQGLMPFQQQQLLKQFLPATSLPLGALPPGFQPTSIHSLQAPPVSLASAPMLGHMSLQPDLLSKDLTTKLKPAVNQLPAKFTPY